LNHPRHHRSRSQFPHLSPSPYRRTQGVGAAAWSNREGVFPRDLAATVLVSNQQKGPGVIYTPPFRLSSSEASILRFKAPISFSTCILSAYPHGCWQKITGIGTCRYTHIRMWRRRWREWNVWTYINLGTPIFLHRQHAYESCEGFGLVRDLHPSRCLFRAKRQGVCYRIAHGHDVRPCEFNSFTGPRRELLRFHAVGRPARHEISLFPQPHLFLLAGDERTKQRPDNVDFRGK